MMSNEGEKRCPLCAEEMDWTDQQFMPCKCGYQICVWCWHHIIDMAEKDVTEGRCPACRSIYEKEKIVAMQAKCERTMMKISNRKMKPPKAKPKSNNDVKKDLTNVRVIQRKMAYVIGLPLSLADEDVLIRKEYFGQYGKVTKVSLSRTAGGAVQQFVNDTCSAYITYSKEDEALRCIQSVHGFVLEDKYLRASFGTAKYCHAWLKNMPCNNPSCLYLHSVGPDEDSFGKDEVAAVHTRSRVQQIVGDTNNVAKRSGSVLPRADDMFNGGFSSTERSLVRNGMSDGIAVPSKEKEGTTAVPHKMTSFVDIVGRSNSDSTEKYDNSPEDRRYIDQCLELSMISGDVHTRQPYSIPAMFEKSSSNCSGKYSLLSSNEGAKDTYVSSHRSSFLHPSYSANSSDGQALSAKKAHSVNDLTVDWNSAHSRKDRVSLPTSSLNSTLNDFSQEVKFQNSTKSDRIYRSSRSFSNEEIVEHLRRISDDKLTNDEENSALDAVESSIISNIMSIDFDSSDDSLTMPNCLSEFLDESYCFGSSSWSSLNSDQSGYSFSKQEGCSGQTAGLVLPDYADNKEHYMCRPQYPATRTQCLVPPGFSVPSRDPPPGYSSSDRVASRTSSGTLMPNALLQQSSTRLGTGFDDVDLFDPAILGFGKGKQTRGFAARPSGTPGLSGFEDESRLWLSMQQSHPDSKFPQMFTSPAAPLQQETCTSHLRNRLSTLDGIYGLSSQLADQHQNCSRPFFSETSQQKYANPNDHFPDRGEAGVADLGRNERLGMDRYFPGSYGDVMLSSGDVFARRVFGL